MIMLAALGATVALIIFMLGLAVIVLALTKGSDKPPGA